MKNALGATRAALTWFVATACLLTAATLTAGPALAASDTYTVTAATSVRATPAATGTVLGALAKGAQVKAAAAASDGWLPITYAAVTGYVAEASLSADKASAPVVTTGPAGKKLALAPVNIREAASLDAAILAVLDKDTVVKVTGLTSGGFTQIAYDGKTRWIYTEFLSVATDTTPDVVATYKTTAKLALRVTGELSAKNQRTIAKGKKVSGTGNHSGSYSQVKYGKSMGWVITGYLKAVSGTPSAFKLPLRKYTRYVVAAGAIVRASADAESAQVTTLAAATALRTTGSPSKGFTAIIWDGTVKWVASNSIAKTKPKVATPLVPTVPTVPADPTDLGSASLNKLEPYGKAAVVDVRANFPQIKTIHGWRSSSDYSTDHPSGRAIDNMIPSYKTNTALGDALADYAIANAARLHITYVIWRQRNYRIDRGYWVKMSDRGGDTANHMDHVHISFQPS